MEQLSLQDVESIDPALRAVVTTEGTVNKHEALLQQVTDAMEQLQSSLPALQVLASQEQRIRDTVTRKEEEEESDNSEEPEG